MGPGKYTFTASGGGTGLIQVPAPGPAQDLEELRAIVKAPPVTYLAVTVDNRKGSEFINMYGVSIFTPEGKELTYKEAHAYVEELRNKLPPDVPSSVWNKFADVGNSYLDGASPLEVKDFTMVGPEVPSQITGITVSPTGMFNPVNAEPAAR